MLSLTENMQSNPSSTGEIHFFVDEIAFAVKYCFAGLNSGGFDFI